MTYQEEIRELRSRIDEYEGILEKLITAPYSDGVIASEEGDGMYLVKKRTGDTVILPVKPQKDGSPLRLFLNTKVIISNNATQLAPTTRTSPRKTRSHSGRGRWIWR